MFLIIVRLHFVSSLHRGIMLFRNTKIPHENHEGSKRVRIF